MKTVILATCANSVDAHLLQGLLENEGIKSVIESEIISTMLPDNAIGGVPILVFEKDYIKAREIYERSKL